MHRGTIEEPVERLNRTDLTVWELTMRSWHLLYDFTPEAYTSAKTLLERALATDPQSAEANMVLSLINYHIAILGFASDPAPSPAIAAAHALGHRAMQPDGRNEYAIWAIGISCCGLNRLDCVTLCGLSRPAVHADRSKPTRERHERGRGRQSGYGVNDPLPRWTGLKPLRCVGPGIERGN